MEVEDIRWKQRFQNFEKAYKRLERAVRTIEEEPENELLQAGLIQTYEYTFELAWKVMKDYLQEEGFDVPSPKRTLRQAFQSGYISEGALWMKALEGRNLTSHAYDEAIALMVIRDIRERYFPLLRDFYFRFSEYE